jgi:hypothetical protein
VADRDLAGEADQDVQAQRCDRKDADLDRDAEAIAKLRLVAVGKIVVSAAYEVRKSPDGIREGLAIMDYTRSMSLVPNRP